MCMCCTMVMLMFYNLFNIWCVCIAHALQTLLYVCVYMYICVLYGFTYDHLHAFESVMLSTYMCPSTCIHIYMHACMHPFAYIYIILNTLGRKRYLVCVYTIGLLYSQTYRDNLYALHFNKNRWDLANQYTQIAYQHIILAQHKQQSFDS